MKKQMTKSRLQILERAANYSDWLEIENATLPTSGETIKFTEMIGYLYQWKEKYPDHEYKLVLIQETTLVVAE